MGEPAAALSIELPEKSADLTQWAAETARRLDAATRCPPETLPQVLPAETCCQLLERCQKVLHLEPTLLEVTPPAEGQVVVVGDTHGQFHDVCRMLELVGSPSTSNIIVFNGDFVDRGAWGLETLLLLVAWKLALPRHFFLLRGNHESATCTMCYGFKGELVAKYGKSHWRPVYAACKRLFSSLPVSAKVGQHTLVLHGGLFRRQPQRGVGKNKRKRAHPLLYGLDDVTLGTLEDLARSTKGGMDPNGLGTSRLASDVLWSDPVGDLGFSPNLTRGVGMCFGPDVTERFLTENGLRLVLRSHEGPDAREGREDMQPMSAGYTLDHDTPAGKLMTVFSAPDYPQFIAEETDRYNNLAAVAVLTAPDWATPAMRQYAAAHPRPEARPYYDLWVPDSDEEFEPAASDASGMTDVERPTASLVSTASEAGTVQQEGDAEQQQQQEGHSAEQQQAVPGIGTREKADSLLAGSAAAADVEATAAATAATAAAAAAAAAAQETSNRSEETAVADLGDGVSCALVQPVQLPAAFAAKASQQQQQQQHQRSPKRTRGAAAAGSTVAAA